MNDLLTSTPIRTPAPPPMVGKVFRHWERLRESREGGALARWSTVVVAGVALAGLTAWRADAVISRARRISGSLARSRRSP